VLPWNDIQLIVDPDLPPDPGFRQIGPATFAVHPECYELAKMASDAVANLTQALNIAVLAMIPTAKYVPGFADALVHVVREVMTVFDGDPERTRHGSECGIVPAPSAN